MIETFYARDGAFRAGGVELPSILQEHATPFYLYSADVIEHKYQTLRGRFPRHDIFYSLKANPSLAICHKLRAIGAHAEVSSLGELATVLRAGFAPENILFVGPAKSAEEIRSAIDSSIYAIVTDSSYELELIDSLARERRRCIDVLLRINTFERPEGVTEVMVGGPSKFGFDEEVVAEQVRELNLEYVRIRGIQVYSASQVLDAGFICDHLRIVLDLALRLRKEIGFELRCVDFGGGFGVPYDKGERELDLDAIAEVAGRLIKKHSDVLRESRLIFEVGRFLIAEAGVFLTRVLRVKRSRGRVFVVTDGGMNHFSRPAFMNVRHPIRILNKIGEPAEAEFEVCGPCCTPLDVLGTAVPLPHPEVGDVVGVFNAGAYGYSMSMLNFLSYGWPTELWADSGRVTLVREGKAANRVLEGQSAPGF